MLSIVMLLGVASLASAPTPAPAQTPSASAASRTEPAGGGSAEAIAELRRVVALQKATLADARAVPDLTALEDMRPRLQRIVDGYEAMLKRHPDFAAGWAAYGLFMCDPQVEERRPALALLLRANNLDPDLPVVKNQIGVLMAEEGRVIDALNYFLAASDLAPTEALYHFQIGLLLDEGRDHFLKTRAWTRATLERTMLEAFARAAALAPDRTDFAYRGAEAYYDLAEPRWDEAYAAWSALEARLTGKVELQAVRLHLARVRWHQGYAADARELLASVTAPTLAGQKARLAAEFLAEEKAEAEARAASGK